MAWSETLSRLIASSLIEKCERTVKNQIADCVVADYIRLAAGFYQLGIILNLR